MTIYIIMTLYFIPTAEYGDYDSSEHKEDFIQEYQLLPTVMNLDE